MKHGEALPVQTRHVELRGDPRREPENPFHARLVGDADRDRSSHREPQEHRPRSADLAHGSSRILEAPVESLPGLHAVPDLGEGDLRKSRGQPADEPFDRGAPGAFDLPCLAAVHADDRVPVRRPGHTQLRPRRELHELAGPSTSSSQPGSSLRNPGSTECPRGRRLTVDGLGPRLLEQLPRAGPSRRRSPGREPHGRSRDAGMGRRGRARSLAPSGRTR